jgi:tellurite methyltransferase
MPQNEDEKDRWNRKYMEGSHHSLDPEPFLCDAFQRFLARTPPGTALDVAGGVGRHALWLLQRGWKVKLIDISDAGVALARENAARVLASQPEVSATISPLFVAEVVDLNAAPALGDEEFDVVLVFHYLQRELFPALVRALKPHGFLIYQTYLAAQTERPGGPTNPKYMLQPDELLQAFSSSVRVLHYRENFSDKAVAELVAQKPDLR